MGNDIFLDDDLADVALDEVKSKKLRKAYKSDIEQKIITGRVDKDDKAAFKEWATAAGITIGQAVRALACLALADENLRAQVRAWLCAERLRKQVARMTTAEKSALHQILAENGTRIRDENEP